MTNSHIMTIGHPNKLKRRERERLTRKKTILDAARHIFFKKGLMAATVDEIAARAGVAKGTIYLYFESKEEIYFSLMLEGTLLLNEKMEKAVCLPLPAARLLEELQKAYYDFYQKDKEYFRILFLSNHPDIQAKVSQELTQTCIEAGTICLEIVAEVIRKGIAAGEFRKIDPWATAVILWGMVNGMIQVFDQDPRHPEWIGLPLEDLLKSGLGLSLNGIQIPASPRRRNRR